MTLRTKLGTLLLTITLSWTRTKSILLKGLCLLMRSAKSLWRRLKPVGSEMFKEDWVSFGEDPEEGDYYIAIDLAGFEEVGKKRTKNTKLDETAISVVKVGETTGIGS